MDRPVTFYLTPRVAIVVVVALSILIVVGVALALVFIFFDGNRDVRFDAVVTAMAMGLAGSGSWYLRRVYRAGFDGRMEFVTDGSHHRERFATLVYLLSRPLIGVALAVAVILGVILTYTSVAPDTAQPTADLVYLSGAIGFATGFLSGRVIERVEKDGKL